MDFAKTSKSWHGRDIQVKSDGLPDMTRWNWESRETSVWLESQDRAVERREESSTERKLWRSIKDPSQLIQRVLISTRMWGKYLRPEKEPPERIRGLTTSSSYTAMAISFSQSQTKKLHFIEKLAEYSERPQQWEIISTILICSHLTNLKRRPRKIKLFPSNCVPEQSSRVFIGIQNI